MNEKKLGSIESRFADMIWQNEPISSGELVAMALEELNWKKSTTYTILKRMCERGIFQNQNSTVTSLISREEFYAMQSEQFVEDAFEGSLPAFLAAFTRRKKLSCSEIDELQKVIDSMRG